MSQKRKDPKGRILKKGETVRDNKSYVFRYQRNGKRHAIYAPTLEELRIKEAAIERDLRDGIDISGGNITVSELVNRYINLKRSLKQNSQRAYRTVVKHIEDDPFGQRPIKTVKISDAKTFYIQLHDEGMKRNTISIYHCVLRPAFEMAVDDDLIRKNPFKFNISDILPDDKCKRQALTKEQQHRYLQFVEELGGNYYDDIVILLYTGLRVSELYGLTKSDIDFDNRCIQITKQLCRTAERPYYVEKPKTNSGVRYIPMNDKVYMALQRVVASRPQAKVERIVDGYNGFLFLDKNEMPKVAMNLEGYMRNVQRKYIAIYGDTLPTVTPHVLRHTFATNCQQAGMDVKSLQYLMGHSNVSVTLDIYTHSDYCSAQRAFDRIASSL